MEAEGDYVILNMKNNEDHINLLLHYMEHSFSHVYASINVATNAKHFNLECIFTKYALNQHMEIVNLGGKDDDTERI